MGDPGGGGPAAGRRAGLRAVGLTQRRSVGGTVEAAPAPDTPSGGGGWRWAPPKWDPRGRRAQAGKCPSVLSSLARKGYLATWPA